MYIYLWLSIFFLVHSSYGQFVTQDCGCVLVEAVICGFLQKPLHLAWSVFHYTSDDPQNHFHLLPFSPVNHASSLTIIPVQLISELWSLSREPCHHVCSRVYTGPYLRDRETFELAASSRFEKAIASTWQFGLMSKLPSDLPGTLSLPFPFLRGVRMCCCLFFWTILVSHFSKPHWLTPSPWDAFCGA